MGIFKNFLTKEHSKEGTAVGNSETTPFSMKIEDVFTIKGRGVVATGTIQSGSIKSNSEVVVAGGNEIRGAKVIGIEKSNKFVNEAKTGDMVGLLLDGISENSVKKGYIVADSRHPILMSFSEVEVPSAGRPRKRQKEDDATNE
ncbi:MAG: hypothetical protein Pg6C_19380 [Treponemataceae bacterium]|nr:MAG: hypothetical protein Pg6C_19380 [Treponemataceae bacterium]